MAKRRTYTVYVIELSRDCVKEACVGPFSTRREAEAAEKAVADALEKRGHRVFWG